MKSTYSFLELFSFMLMLAMRYQNSKLLEQIPSLEPFYKETVEIKEAQLV